MIGPNRVPGMPRPLADELLYSVVARAHRYLAYWSPKALNRAVYGKQSVVACVDLPSSLGLMEGLARDTWQMTLEDLAMKHTLVGYYTYHRGPQHQRETINAMRGLSEHLHVRLGICASAVLVPRRLRLCAVCVAEDMQSRGETYWRRSHHLPGVSVCARHGVPLMETEVPFRPFTRHTYVPARPAMLDNALALEVAPESLKMAQIIAGASADLLDQPASSRDWSAHWRAELTKLGLAGKHGSLGRLRKAFIGCFGEALLGSLFRSPLAATRWLEEVARKSDRPLHPLKQVLLQVFVSHMECTLGCAVDSKNQVESGAPKTWGLYRCPRLREEAQQLSAQGLTIRGIARALRVDWKTAERLLKPIPPAPVADPEHIETDRAAWQTLMDAYPDKTRKQLRECEPALYARLYRNDRVWLIESGPRQCGHNAGGPRVDWQRRDVQLAADIRAHAAAILSRQPLVRVTRHRVTAELDCTALVEHFSAQLPLTQRTLEEVCESVRVFQIRRLADIIRREGPGDACLPSSLFRRARISRARYADGGQALIKQALLRVNRTSSVASS